MLFRSLFSAAVQRDLNLIEDGVRRRVVLASPTTLIALLTTIAYSWRQEAVAANAREVAQLGREFYERLAKFAAHLDDMGRKLKGAVDSYNDAVGSLESRVIVSARKLKELEVTSAGDIESPDEIDVRPRAIRQIGLPGLPQGSEGADAD